MAQRSKVSLTSSCEIFVGHGSKATNEPSARSDQNWNVGRKSHNRVFSAHSLISILPPTNAGIISLSPSPIVGMYSITQ